MPRPAVLLAALRIENLGEEVLAPVVVENQPVFFLRFRLARRRGDDACDGVAAGRVEGEAKYGEKARAHLNAYN